MKYGIYEIRRILSERCEDGSKREGFVLWRDGRRLLKANNVSADLAMENGKVIKQDGVTRYLPNAEDPSNHFHPIKIVDLIYRLACILKTDRPHETDDPMLNKLRNQVSAQFRKSASTGLAP